LDCKRFSSFLEMRRKDEVMNQISHKFSISELKKMKSLIKFAKNNNLLEKILEKDGEISLGDIAKDNISNNLSTLFQNYTKQYEVERQEISKEIQSMKLMQVVKQAKLNSYFTETNENVNAIKEIMLFTKNFNTDFKNQILGFGKNLKEINNKMETLTSRMNRIEAKSTEIGNMARNNNSQSNNGNINPKMLKEYLKNSTKDIVDQYKKIFQAEVSKLNGKKIPIVVKKNVVVHQVVKKLKKEKHIEKKKKETKKEENTDDQNEEKQEEENKSKSKIVKPSTFANEDDFDETGTRTDDAPEQQEKKASDTTPKHEAIDYSEKLW